MAIAICVGGVLVFNNAITMGVLIAYISTIKKLIEPLSRCYQLVVRSQTALVSVSRVFEVIDIQPEKNVLTGASNYNDMADSPIISFKDVTFGYGQENVLVNVSFNVRKGERIAFVGESGSGKSTLIRILLGLLKYNQGEVRLGDMELKEICLNNLYDRVSYLSQDAPVFDGTIKENLVFEKQVSEEQMLGALSEVQLSHLVENLAEGLNTEIGEKGTCLSGGEKQRLALARLWFEDSELVILDEATSAMDNLTEENVMKSVMQKMKDKTVIAIAHRLNSIAGFDRIILFKEGRIVGQGTFEELLHTDSYFMDLYNANVK